MHLIAVYLNSRQKSRRNSSSNFETSVKKKHLTPTPKYDMIPKVVTDGKICGTDIVI